MANKILSIRKIGQEVSQILNAGDLQQLLNLVDSVPAEKVINSLIRQFYQAGSIKRWWVITAFGRTTARIADKDMEKARILMRRLMWSLNDESGGIGWSAPEAMAEAMVNVHQLAEEYSSILLSYIREDGNFLEYPPLRHGALWGLMRFAQKERELFSEIEAGTYLVPYLSDPDIESRGLAALSLGYSRLRKYADPVKAMEIDSDTKISVWLNQELKIMNLKEIAEFSLKLITQTL